MANTRASVAPKLRRSARNQASAASAASKPVGVTKKKVAGNPKHPPKPKSTIRATKNIAAVVPTASKVTAVKASKRKRSEREDKTPAPKAKRSNATEPKAKAAPVPAPTPPKPITHRYGTRSKKPAPTPPPSAPSPPPEPEPEPEPELHQPPPPPLLPPFPPPPPQPAPYRSIYSALPPPPPPPSPSRSDPGYLSYVRQKYRIPAHHKPGYRPDYEAKRRHSTAELKKRGDRERKAHLDCLSRERQAEARYNYQSLSSQERNHPNFRLRSKKKLLEHYKRYQSRVRQARDLQFQVDKKAGVAQWKMYRVHESSPLRQEECGVAWEKEERERAEEEKARLARERFEAEKAAGLVEDADLYGDDYDPYAEDY